MGTRSRFVRAETTTLKISNGDTLTVKRRLNTGETRDKVAAISTPGDDGFLKVNRLTLGLGQVMAYLVDWSLTDDEGNLVVIRNQPTEVIQAAIDALDPEDFAEILAAIQAHDVTVAQARAAEKNDQGGATESPAISPSPDGAAGDTSGSAS